MKSFKAMMAEVAQPEPAEEKAFKAQHTVVADKHPVALETQHKGTKPKAKRKADQEGDANYDLAYESVALDEVKVKNSDAAFKLETEISNLEKRIAKLTPLAPKDDDANMKLFSAKKSLKQKQDSLRGLMREAADTADADEMSMAMQQADFLAYVAKEMKSHLKSGKEFPEWMQNKLSKLQASAQDLHSNFGDHGEDEEDDMDEALSSKQKKIDHNKNGKIDGQDLAMIRAKKNESSCGTSKKMKEQVELDETGGPLGYLSPEARAKEVDRRKKALKANETPASKRFIDNALKNIKAKNEEAEIEEALKGNQHKIDKNKNGKIDAHDFKLLKKEEVEQVEEAESHQSKTTMKHISNPTAGEKKAAKDIKPGIAGVADRIAMLKSAQARGALKNEAAEKPVSPFDLKNYKSQIPTKAGEKAGFDSKKVSTGTVYSRKPVKEAAYEKDMDDKKKVIVKGVKGMKSTPFTKTFRNMAAYDKWSDSDVAGDYEVNQVMHESAEQIDEAFQQGIVKFKDGSSSVLKKEDADILNKLMGGMSSGSVKKMTETAMKDKKGFAEILAFAKEAM